MTPLEKLISWHEKWALKNRTVICKRCGAEQSEQDRDLKFNHATGCPDTRFGAEPWKALDEVRDSYWTPTKTSSVDQDANLSPTEQPRPSSQTPHSDRLSSEHP